MTKISGKFCALLGAAVLASIAIGPVRSERKTDVASALTVRGITWNGKASSAADPTNPIWKSASPVSILLNTTPRIVATDKVDQSAPPAATARCVMALDGTVVCLMWKDATKDQPDVHRSSPADAGGRVRVVHTDKTNRFYDAGAVMVPVNRCPAANPCIQMGEKNTPVELYYWRSVSSPVVMTASGRGTTLRTHKTFQSKAIYAKGQWQVTFVLPKLANRTPLAFAIWDGSKGQRGGLKYYSLWHSLSDNGRAL